MPNKRLTLSQSVELELQKTVPDAAKKEYWIIIIKIKPREFAKPPISLDFHSAWPWNLIDPLTLREFEKKKIKNKGKYINKTSIISGWNTLTPINQNL